MLTPGSFADTLKQQADIVRIIGDYVQLKKAGAQNFTGLCPFHKEKSPSFSVHATRQFYHCFGCGLSGDVFNFVQKIENITFPEAVRHIAKKLEIPIPRQGYSHPGEAHEARLRGALLELHEKACVFFEEHLRRPEGARAREYLAGRGLDDQTLRTFRIGFAPDSGFLLRDRLRGMADEELLKASGLFSWKQAEHGKTTAAEAGPAREQPVADIAARTSLYSKFRNRVMFPIRNEQGKVIAFTGRALDTGEKAGPKYLNSPETPIYSKGRVLFNLDKAKDAVRKLDYAILVEGNVDCISVFMAGFQNVIATSGTAFSQAQVGLLGRFTKNVVVNFDPDNAGAAATERSLGMLIEEEFQVKVLTLESGFDPDLFIRSKGAKAYAEALMSTPDYFSYLISRAASTFPVKTPEGKAKAVNFLLPYIKRVPAAIVRDELANNIAQRLGIDSALLRHELRRAATSRTVEIRTLAEPQISDAEKILIRLFAPRATTPQAGDHLTSGSSRGPRTDGDPGCTREFAGLQGRAASAVIAENLHRGLATESLLEWLISAMQSTRGNIDEISSIASESDRGILASVLMREADELTPELVESALAALRERVLQRRKRELSASIAEAERRNDAATLTMLLEEKLRIERELRSS